MVNHLLILSQTELTEHESGELSLDNIKLIVLNDYTRTNDVLKCLVIGIPYEMSSDDFDSFIAPFKEVINSIQWLSLQRTHSHTSAVFRSHCAILSFLTEVCRFLLIVIVVIVIVCFHDNRNSVYNFRLFTITYIVHLSILSHLALSYQLLIWKRHPQHQQFKIRCRLLLRHHLHLPPRRLRVRETKSSLHVIKLKIIIVA